MIFAKKKKQYSPAIILVTDSVRSYAIAGMNEERRVVQSREFIAYIVRLWVYGKAKKAKRISIDK